MMSTSQGVSINLSSATRLSPLILKKFSMAAAGGNVAEIAEADMLGKLLFDDDDEV